MLRDAQFSMTLFVALNWILTLAVSAALAWVWNHRRQLFVKPSMMVVGFFHIFCQWPLAVYAAYFDTWLPNAFDLAILVHGFVIGTLTTARFTWPDSVNQIWSRIQETQTREASNRRLWLELVFPLVLAALILLAVYFYFVPPECTGLWAIFVYPAEVPYLRELSLKLLPSVVPKYVFSVLAYGVASVLASLIFLFGMRAVGKRAWLDAVGVVALLIFIFAIVMIPGAKGGFVRLAMIFLATALWARGLRGSIRSLTPLIGAGIAAMLIPVMGMYLLADMAPPDSSNANQGVFCAKKIGIDTASVGISAPVSVTSVTSGIGIDTASAGISAPVSVTSVTSGISMKAAPAITTPWHLKVWYQGKEMFFRFVVVPFEVGAWYIHFAQTTGFTGPAGIPKLAAVLGIPPRQLSAEIAQRYGPEYYGHSVGPSATAPGGFLFELYAVAGLIALPLCVGAMALLDFLSLLLLSRLDRFLLIAALSTLTASLAMLTQAGLGVVLLTHGVIPCMAIIAVLSILQKAHFVAGRTSSLGQ